MLLMIDNYDSFTYNLVQYLKVLGQDVQVARNDEISAEQAASMQPSAVVISPGPCTPAEAGVSVDLIRELSGRIPILGVCLGMQSIATAFGGTVIKAQHIMHGKVSDITHGGRGIFTGIKSPFPAIRYHSLAVERESLPACLNVTATADDNEIMGLEHQADLTVGIQFHPESILTPSGKRLLGNFLKLVAKRTSAGRVA